MTAHPPDTPGRRERVTHRLEAFSDIVIGFSLAQLTLSLVIPAHAIDFVQRPAGIIAFLVTFVLVVRFWWLHFVIFEHYFVPNRLAITANFVALASLILQIFSLQLYSHFVPLGEGIVASRIYFGLFVLSYGMLVVMMGLGVQARWALLSVGRRRAAVQAMIRIGGTITGCAIGDLFSTGAIANLSVSVGDHREIVATIPWAILFAILVGSIIGFVAARLVPRYVPELQTR